MHTKEPIFVSQEDWFILSFIHSYGWMDDPGQLYYSHVKTLHLNLWTFTWLEIDAKPYDFLKFSVTKAPDSLTIS